MNLKTPTIVFMGYGKGLRLICDVALKNYHVGGIFTQDESFYKENHSYFKNLQKYSLYENIVDYCESKDIDCYRGSSVCDNRSIEWFKSKRPDIIISYSLWEIVSESFLSEFQNVFNIHGSNIPNLMGRAPQSWSILNGFSEIGFSIHKMTLSIDQGDLAKQINVLIKKDDIPLTILERQLEVLPSLFKDFLSDFSEDNIDYRKHDIENGNYWPRLETEVDGRINWDLPSFKIERIVRAFNHPFLGAWCTWKEKKIRILNLAVKKPDFISTVSGVIFRISEEGCYVTTGDGICCISRVAVDGKEKNANEVLKLGNILK